MKRMQHRALIFLGLIASLLVTPAFPGNEEDTSTAAAKSIIEPFLKANAESKYKMTTKHYQDIYKNSEFLAATFSKEWYGVKSYDEIRTYSPKSGTDKETIEVELTLEWAFEGYEGVQTCHFKLQRDLKEWRIDWVLC